MILITGGMGFIGLHTARRLLDAGEDVVITRYRTWREPDFLKDQYGKRVQIESVDTTSHHDVLGAAVKHHVTAIVHLSVPALAALTPAEDGGDICYAKDCALGIQLLTMAKKLNHRVYNLSSGVTVTNRQLADAVRKAVPGAQMELQLGKGPSWRPNNYLDIARITADTGYNPQYTVETAIADYVRWLRSGHVE
jgi:nucleoside-diphosphate-sugar epimerase